MIRISRRGFLGIGGAALLADVAPRALSAAERRKPNLVFILIDDMGWPDTGCYGHREIFALPSREEIETREIPP